MRKILRWDTTFINRDNTNENIYKEVNKQMENEGKTKIIKTFAQSYKQYKMKRIKKTIQSTEEIHDISFDNNLIPRIPPNRNQGRPKYKWTERAMLEFWEHIRLNIPNMTNTEYDKNNITIRNHLIEQSQGHD